MFILTHRSGIYEIINHVNGKRYVGSSINLKNRRSTHFEYLRLGRHHNTHLQASYNKYGREAFVFRVLLYCEPFELLRYEQFFIDNQKPEYNQNILAMSSAGSKRSDATRAKMREIARNRPPQVRAKQAAAIRGRHQTPESNQKRSEKLKGRIFPQETLDKISAALKGRKFTPEWLEKNKQAQLGKHLTPETKEKIRKSSTGRKHTQEEKDKIREANTGRVFTPEHRQHISDAKKKRGNA